MANLPPTHRSTETSQDGEQITEESSEQSTHSGTDHTNGSSKILMKRTVSLDLPPTHRSTETSQDGEQISEESSEQSTQSDLPPTHRSTETSQDGEQITEESSEQSTHSGTDHTNGSSKILMKRTVSLDLPPTHRSTETSQDGEQITEESSEQSTHSGTDHTNGSSKILMKRTVSLDLPSTHRSTETSQDGEQITEESSEQSTQSGTDHTNGSSKILMKRTVSLDLPPTHRSTETSQDGEQITEESSEQSTQSGTDHTNGSSKILMKRTVSLDLPPTHRSTETSQDGEQITEESSEQSTHSGIPSYKKSLERSVSFDPSILQRPPSHLSIRSWNESFKQDSLSDSATQPEPIAEEPIEEEHANTTADADVSVSLLDDSGASTVDEGISQIGACIECVKAVPVFSQEEIEIGDHIIFAGAVYDHHGIVVEKHSDRANIEIVEATNTISGVAVGMFIGRKARISISEKNLDFSKQKIWVVVYRKRMYSKEQIAKRAIVFKEETKNDKYKYDLFDNNCEHFATFCVTGQKFSIQATKFRLTLKLFLASGFRGISDERIRNQREFDNEIICKTCYQMNEGLLSVNVIPITNGGQVAAGDIIRYSYYNLWHDAVVLKKEDEQEKYITCRIAHYAFCGIFSHRTITAENIKITFDGKCSKLEYEPPKYNVYDPATVVERAKRRLDEQEFVFFSNDSSHYARWCKLKLEKASDEKTEDVVLTGTTGQ